MSQYLIDQIDSTENITVSGFSEVTEAHGNGKLEQLTLRDNSSNTLKKVDAGALLIFIGAKPYTDWLELDIMWGLYYWA